ncbi:DUF4388 domain-containing protein [Phormidium tenue FACHB-886]|nr:DUF4388 domain-containing protein [Phormidium tenue FACHB-886]
MAVTGYLAEFSLAELFQFLEQGNRVGLLTICTLTNADSEKPRNYYIWFNQGRIVATSNTLDQQGLLRMISQRGWLGNRAASRLAQSCAVNTPLGLCLKSQGVLNAEQLKLLFYAQVMQQICALFTLKDGWFQFDVKAPMSTAEMTGLSAPATEVTLAGLRALKDWSALADKLPEPTSALISAVKGKPQQRLNQVEWQVWEFVNGTISISAIAKQLQLPLEKVQQTAFRLIVSGVAEEMPMVANLPQTVVDSEPVESIAPQSETTQVSHSFLQSLVGFLRNKV